MNDILGELMRCRTWIEDALEYSGGTHDFVDIIEAVMRGRMQLWPGERGCLVTEIVVYPKKKHIHVFLGGGEMQQILDMHKDVIEWAKGQGCTAATIAGRVGWKKPLAEYGWTQIHASFIKEFE